MLDWWADNGPPVYISVAAYLGLIKTGSDSSSAKEPGDLNDLVKMAGAGGMIQ
jgi:hypothetical protein